LLSKCLNICSERGFDTFGLWMQSLKSCMLASLECEPCPVFILFRNYFVISRQIWISLKWSHALTCRLACQCFKQKICVFLHNFSSSLFCSFETCPSRSCNDKLMTDEYILFLFICNCFYSIAMSAKNLQRKQYNTQVHP
jgi:hypothetical protein